MPLWSIITVTYNSLDALRGHEFATDDDAEWIVVDNNSSDGSAEKARELGAHVIELSQNLGFARANNIGVGDARGKYLLFMNPDVTPVASDLPNMERELDSRGGIIAPQLVNDDGSLQPNGRGGPYLIRKIRNRVTSSERVNSSYHCYANPEDVLNVEWVIGAALAVRRTDFEKIGCWNERYFLYYEDADICIRAKKHELPVRVLGSCRWRHSWARETMSFSRNAWQNEFKSALKFYTENPKFLLPVL